MRSYNNSAPLFR